MTPQVEQHPAGYLWTERFPGAERVAAFEGGAQYTAESDGYYWLITDEGTLADLLDSVDDADVIGRLIVIRRFLSRSERGAWIHPRRDGSEQDDRDYADPMEGLVERLMLGTATRLTAWAVDKQRKWVNERDDLQKCFDAEMLHRLPGTGYRAGISAERHCDFPEEFPGVGDVDALLIPDGRQVGFPVWVELKCGSDTHSLHACAWDAIKCSVGLGRYAAGSAYLIAGLPQRLWNKPVIGVALFDGGEWTASELRSTYTVAFSKYEKRGDPQPTRIQSSITTAPIGAPALFGVAGTPWELRAARVTVPSQGDWYDWSRLTPEPTAS